MNVRESGQGRKTSILPEILNNNLVDYSTETSIHGLKYLVSSGKIRLIEKIFWIIIFITSISCLAYCGIEIAQKWFEYPVMIIDNQQPTQIFEIPFPSITVCPAIKFKKEKLNIDNLSAELDQLADKTSFEHTKFGQMFEMSTQICSTMLARSVVMNLTVASPYLGIQHWVERDIHKTWSDTLKEMSPTHKDIFQRCVLSTWEKDEIRFLSENYNNCLELFSPIITNEGLCFTFNTIGDILRTQNLHNEFSYHNITQQSDGWEPDTGYTMRNVFPIRAMVKGELTHATDGITFVLSANLSDRLALCQPTTLGYKLTLNSPSTYPNTHDTFIPIQYGKEYTISVKPKIITTPDSLRSFRPEKRQCYFSDERQLKYYKFYSEENCHLECFANFSIKVCRGAPFASPRSSDITNCLAHGKDFAWDYPKHFYSVFMFNEKYHITDSQTDSGRSESNCDCLPECNKFAYDYEINEIDSSLETNPINENRIHVFFNQPTFVGRTRVKVYTFITLLSDFGGLLGLFMGGSVISLFELFYFLTIRSNVQPR